MNNQIKCPNCGFEFDVDQVLEHQAEEKIKQEYESKFKQKEQEYKQDLEKEKKQIAAETARKAKEDSEAEIKALREENEKKTDENLKLKKKEVELLRKEREMKEKEEYLRLEIEKEYLAKWDDKAKEIKKSEEVKQELKIKELEKQLGDQKTLIDEMKKKAEQGSMQLQGEVQELVIEEWLTENYKYDKINEVPKGQRGADVIQEVVNSFGQKCGVIMYESKRTKSFSEGWIIKLKDDMRNGKADLGVIVTETMPKDMDRFGQKEGVWVCSYNEFKGLSFVLREMIIKLNESKESQTNKGTKIELLYNFLTGSEFRQEVEAIVEAFTEMKSQLDKEKIAMQKIWKEREKHIERIISNTAEMYGSIRGIAGAALPPIKNLELPEHN